MTLSLGSAFSGVGRFEAGLAVCGYETAWQIEAIPFRRRVLQRRFGTDPMPDVREATGMQPVDAFCLGFPCQDLSAAGLGAGITGSRSSLWNEGARIVAELRPQVVYIENVPLLLRRGFDVVVRDLTSLGYGVEWDCIPAAAVGAPHLRDRVWVVAILGMAEPQVFGAPLSLFPHPPAAIDDPQGWRRWPRAGFATDDATVVELDPVAPMTSVRDGTFTPWPTPHGMPRAGQARNPGPSGNELGAAVNRAERQGDDRWPTPSARDYKDVGDGRYGQLPDAVRRWPTPNAADGEGGRVDAEVGGVRPSGAKRTVTLGTAAKHWPTPKSSPSGPDYARAGRDGSGGDDLATAAARDAQAGSLNPPWVEWLMGMPCGWTDPELSNDDLQPVPWSDEPLPRLRENVPGRNDRLSAIGDSLVAAVPAHIAARVRDVLASVVVSG